MERIGAGYTILLVDDDTGLLPSLVVMLQVLSDFTIMTAANGMEALERIIEHIPDCAVVDVRMPLLDGYQLVRALRGDPKTSSLPLIILTAMTEERDQFTGFASGVDQYLLKPVKPLDLLAAIQTALIISDAMRSQSLRALAETTLPDQDH